MKMTEWLRLKSGPDIRGDAMEHDGKSPTLTENVARCIGYAFALWLAERTHTTTDRLVISVGRDSRLSGEKLAAAFIKGLTAADCDVLDCGLCTTPAMALTTIEPETSCDGAVMTTAGRLPWYKNGFKLMTREGGLNEDEMTEILTRAAQVSLPQRLVSPISFLDTYQERLRRMVHDRLEDEAKMPLLGLHVVVDAGNGSGGFYAGFLETLGAEVTGSQFLEPNGIFPNHLPDPQNQAAVESLSRAVVENTADLGVLFDADCDQVVIVDETGRAIDRNRLIALISAILLEESPGATIATDSVTSSGLTRFITEWGGVHYRYKRGHQQLIEEAVRLNDEGIDCPLAIETSGHAAFRENYFLDDGVYLVTRLLCEAMDRKREGLTLASLIDELAEPKERVELRLSLTGEEPKAASQAVIETVLSRTLEDPAWRLNTDNREGVRITFDLDGEVGSAWLQIRKSLHDPVLVLNAESDAEGGVKWILQSLYDLIRGAENLDLGPLKKELGLQ